MILNQLRDSWEQQKRLSNSLQEWDMKYQTVCQHVHEACRLLSAKIPKVMSLQQTQENAHQGLHRLEMVFQGLRSQSCQDSVRMQAQIPRNLNVKLDHINSQMAILEQALQRCQQNMVETSDLEALKNVWSRNSGHLSAQIKSVQTQVSSVVLPQLEVFLGTETSTKEGLRRLNHQTSEETILHMVSEAFSVA